MNCGQNRWPAGFDAFPCQRDAFVHSHSVKPQSWDTKAVSRKLHVLSVRYESRLFVACVVRDLLTEYQIMSGDSALATRLDLQLPSPIGLFACAAQLSRAYPAAARRGAGGREVGRPHRVLRRQRLRVAGVHHGPRAHQGAHLPGSAESECSPALVASKFIQAPKPSGSGLCMSGSVEQNLFWVQGSIRSATFTNSLHIFQNA